MLLIPFSSVLTYPIPKGHSHFISILLRTSAVMCLARHTVFHQQPSLVAKRYCLTSARFSNDAGKRLVTFYDSTRTSGASRFLLNSADYYNWMLERVCLRKTCH